MGIRERWKGGFSGKEARRGETIGKDLKVEEAENEKIGLRSTQFVAVFDLDEDPVNQCQQKHAGTVGFLPDTDDF